MKLACTVVALCLIASTLSAEGTGNHFSALDDIVINHRINGDVIVLGADLELGPEAFVEGHAIALFGRVHRHESAQVDGRTIAIASLSSLALQPGSDPEFVWLNLGLRLLSSGGWLLVTTVLAFVLPIRLRHGSHLLIDLGLRIPALGLVVVLTLFTALVAVLGLGPSLGVPLAATLMVVFVLFKALGLTMIGSVIGTFVLKKSINRRLPLTFDVFVGVAIMLFVRLIPLVGGHVWTLASIVALGAGVFVIVIDPNEMSSFGLRSRPASVS